MITEAITITIILLAFFFLFTLLHRKKSLKKLRENYDPNNDQSRKGEEERNLNGGLPKTSSTAFGTSKTDASNARPSEPEGRPVLPSTEVIDDGKASESVRRIKKPRRGIFRKLRRNK